MVKKIPVKPSRKETQAAQEAQAPQKPVNEPKALAKPSVFNEMKKYARPAHQFGEATQFVKPVDLFNSAYREGHESTPFFVRRAWQFTSKEGFGERIGIEIVLSNGRVYNVALSITDGDLKRNGLLKMFAEPNTQPIGPLCFKMLPLGRGNDYYDIVPYGTNRDNSAIDIPFDNLDEDLPF